MKLINFFNKCEINFIIKENGRNNFLFLCLKSTSNLIIDPETHRLCKNKETHWLNIPAELKVRFFL